MNKVPKDISFALVYLDDIVISSKQLADHTENGITILERIWSAGLCLRLSKCKFSCDKLQVLGHIASEEVSSFNFDQIRSISVALTP